jgi:hypothetical protein
MGSSRFVRPETTTLQISNGDWLLVKRRLNHGERSAAYNRLAVARENGTYAATRFLVQVTNYLIDWSLTDEQSAPVIVRGKSFDELTAILNALDPDDFTEINDAIVAHETAMAAERAEEKKTSSGVTASSVISSSPGILVGATSGSVS